MASILQQIGSSVGEKLNEKLNLSGGTVTGSLVIPTPTSESEAAQKAQVSALELSIGSYATFVATIADVTVTYSDTAANITAITDAPNGAIGVANDTSVIYVSDGGVWSVSTIDTVQADSLAAAATLNISGDTESNINARSGDPAGTIMYGTDTDDLYVFDGTDWQTYNNDA